MNWGRALKRTLSTGEKAACARMYELAQENPDIVIDPKTDELGATELLELACDDMDVVDGTDLYKLMEDCAAEIANIYGREGELE